MGRSEAVAERIGKRAKTSGRSDERETRQIQLNGPGRRSFADDDIELVVFHRRVEHFLDHLVEAVDLIDEEHVAVIEIRQD